METTPNVRQIPYAPIETKEELYPESDGKPMADTDLHLYWIKRIDDMFRTHFAQDPGVYISGNIMMYDIEGPDANCRLSRYPYCFRAWTEIPPHL